MRTSALASVIIAASISIVFDSMAGQVELAWDPSPDPLVAGYNIYYGGASLTYTNVVFAGTNTSVTISNLVSSGDYYFAGTVVDTTGMESVYSSEVVYHSAATQCLVSLTNLNQVYDGTPKPVSALTTPAGINVSLTYNGSATAPVAAGNYQVIGTATDPSYTGGATNVLTIARAAASVQLGNLNAVYNGSACQVSTVTTPAGLAVKTLYNGVATAPTNAGSYQVSASIADPNYTGGVTNVMVISKATGLIQASGLNQVYDGAAKTISVTTVPPNLYVTSLYAGVAAPPTNAGTYRVITSIADSNYTADATNTLTVAMAAATVLLSNLTQTYDGTPKPVTTSTTPLGLTVLVTYNGRTQAPTKAGSYRVIGTVTNQNYKGAATNTLTITKTKALSGAGSFSAGALLIKSRNLAPPAASLVLSWPSSTNAITLLQSTDLVTWSTLTNVSSASLLTVPPGPAMKFFKARIYGTNGWIELPLLIQRQ